MYDILRNLVIYFLQEYIITQRCKKIEIFKEENSWNKSKLVLD